VEVFDRALASIFIRIVQLSNLITTYLFRFKLIK